ncbi:MAG: N-6 DNA methylase [Isosphaeraceae bacterium]
MSNGHISWNPASSHSWAKMLGLVDVPLFSPAEQATKPGNPTLLQDGYAVSFAFMTSAGERLELQEDPLSWSWSSNVRHLLIVDPSVQRMFLRRWDRPAEPRQFKTPQRGLGAEDLLALLEGAQPPRTPDVIRHVLSAFRLLRHTLPANSSLESLQLLNGFLLAAQAAQRDEGRAAAILASQTIGEAMAALDRSDQELSGVIDLPLSMRNLRAQALAGFFLDREPRSGCILYSNLLFRHASSQLYQEAHLQIEREPQGLLPGFAPEDEPEGETPKDVRYTPVNLARGLVQLALKALGDVTARPAPLQILDPACGSGVFLQEALRELLRGGFAGTARLKGYDVSNVAAYISKFCLEHAKVELHGSSSINFDIEQTDSLERDWAASDLVLMNPPFIPWNATTPRQKELLRDTLAEAYKGHADLAMAFLLKAAKALKPGGVVASVLPAALLSTVSGGQLRKQILDMADLVAIGKFEGYTYFKTSFVEPSFVVLRRKEAARTAAAPPARVVIAKEGAEDKALRLLRLADELERKEDKQVEIFDVPGGIFQGGVWMPERKGAYELKLALNRLRFPKVGALFTVHQGIRTGDNAAFILTAEEYREIAEPERPYFRPVAGQGALKNGQLLPSYYVFYPYGADGRPSIASEEQLLEVVPRYHELYLRDRKQKLRRRAKVKDWWLLTWSRPWQAGTVHKWVSTYFGASGGFAYDDEGNYVVVQGYAWLGKPKLAGGESVDLQATLRNTPLPWAYLAILNSKLFEVILSGYCPRVQGGQYNLSSRFVKDIPIPSLADPHFSASILDRLADLGRRIHDGGFEELREEINQAAHQAYGLREDSLSSR